MTLNAWHFFFIWPGGKSNWGTFFLWLGSFFRRKPIMIISRIIFSSLAVMLASCAGDHFRYAIITSKNEKVWTNQQSDRLSKQLNDLLVSNGFVRNDLVRSGRGSYGRPILISRYRSEKPMLSATAWRDVETRGGLGVSFDLSLNRIVVSQSVAGNGYHPETLRIVRLVQALLNKHIGANSYSIIYDREAIFVFDPT